MGRLTSLEGEERSRRLLFFVFAFVQIFAWFPFALSFSPSFDSKLEELFCEAPCLSSENERMGRRSTER